jgi:DNA-binding IclR family transcriptional regulator
VHDDGSGEGADRLLLHGLAILDMFARDRQEIGIGEMAQELGLRRSTTSRLVATLAVAGYLESAGEPGRYRLSGRLAALVAAGGDVRRAGLRPDRDGGGEHQHLRARLTHR